MGLLRRDRDNTQEREMDRTLAEETRLVIRQGQVLDQVSQVWAEDLKAPVLWRIVWVSVGLCDTISELGSFFLVFLFFF